MSKIPGKYIIGNHNQVKVTALQSAQLVDMVELWYGYIFNIFNSGIFIYIQQWLNHGMVEQMVYQFMRVAAGQHKACSNLVQLQDLTMVSSSTSDSGWTMVWYGMVYSYEQWWWLWFGVNNGTVWLSSDELWFGTTSTTALSMVTDYGMVW